jgi:hypothetical protein
MPPERPASTNRTASTRPKPESRLDLSRHISLFTQPKVNEAKMARGLVIDFVLFYK